MIHVILWAWQINQSLYQFIELKEKERAIKFQKDVLSYNPVRTGKKILCGKICKQILSLDILDLEQKYKTRMD